MVEIPKQLQNEKFRFVLIAPRAKNPYETQWSTKNNYPYNHDEIIDHHGNLGVVCGCGNLIVLDIDKETYKKYFDNCLDTFTVETGSGGRHYYFICDEQFARNYYVLGDRAGELRVSKSQVVIPNSIHPNGNEYKVVNDIGIKPITKVQVRELLGELLSQKGDITDTSRSGEEWNEVCSMVQGGYSYDECDMEMRLLGYEKWIESEERYRVLTFCNALKKEKNIR